MFVSVRGSQVEIDKDTFICLFDNSIYHDHPKYLKALEHNNIAMNDLITLAREASINYALFFAPSPLVGSMIEKENKKIFQGFSGKFTLGIRGGRINLNTVRMVVKDLKIKQSFIARHFTAPKNPHLRFLTNSPKSPKDQASYILNALNIDMDHMREVKKTKSASMMYIIDQLEKQNIFVALEARTNMPQNMNHARGISGVYIKDSRFPYLFIANESAANFGDGAGRKIFTIMYLIVCLFKGRSKVVSLNDEIKESSDDNIYAIVEEMLLSEEVLPKQNSYTLNDLDELSEKLKVSARAILMRLKHLDYIEDEDTFWQLMNALRSRYQKYQAQQKKLRNDGTIKYIPNISSNIIAYHGKAYVKILKNLYSNGKVSQRQINLHLAYGRQEVNTSDIFRRV